MAASVGIVYGLGAGSKHKDLRTSKFASVSLYILHLRDLMPQTDDQCFLFEPVQLCDSRAYSTMAQGSGV